ncbi:hypothetical protein [Streptomyces sp. NPDC058964]|uniref:hypothetical protein n=1 Tax=Streptomyces sp. NPDC058964 TaxID=3346681 RepID=UPI00369F51EA
MSRFVPREVRELAERRGLGGPVDTGLRAQAPVRVVLGLLTGPCWTVFLPGVVVRLCLGLQEERAAAARSGWYRGVLHRFAEGVALRRLRSVRACTWPEPTTATHGSRATGQDTES